MQYSFDELSGFLVLKEAVDRLEAARPTMRSALEAIAGMHHDIITTYIIAGFAEEDARQIAVAVAIHTLTRMLGGGIHG